MLPSVGIIYAAIDLTIFHLAFVKWKSRQKTQTQFLKKKKIKIQLRINSSYWFHSCETVQIPFEELKLNLFSLTDNKYNFTGVNVKQSQCLQRILNTNYIWMWDNLVKLWIDHIFQFHLNWTIFDFELVRNYIYVYTYQ